MPNLDQAAVWLINRRRKIVRYGWIPSGILGVLLLAAAYHFGKVPVPLILEGQRTTGTIVDYEERPGSKKGEPGFWPVVEFYANARWFRFTHWVGGARGPTGEPVSVLYEAANPSNAMLDRPVVKWMPWGPLTALGLLLTLSALQRWLAMWRT